MLESKIALYFPPCTLYLFICLVGPGLSQKRQYFLFPLFYAIFPLLFSHTFIPIVQGIHYVYDFFSRVRVVSSSPGSCPDPIPNPTLSTQTNHIPSFSFVIVSSSWLIFPVRTVCLHSCHSTLDLSPCGMSDIGLSIHPPRSSTAVSTPPLPPVGFNVVILHSIFSLVSLGMYLYQ